MRQSINRKRIYFYLLIFLFISTTFNYTSISKLNDLSLIKEIDIRGLNDKEENNIRDKLKIFKNNNIFFIKKKEIENILSIFNFELLVDTRLGKLVSYICTECNSATHLDSV